VKRLVLLLLSGAALSALGACCAECFERCDAKALPLHGEYTMEPQPFDAQRPGAILQADMHIGEDEVRVEYTREGKRFRATYAIRARGTTSR
jgi:hypothetical protein